jgi:hypothetical protein
LAELAGGEADEWAYARLERAANRFAEMDAALREGRPAHWVGLSAAPAWPGRAAPVPLAAGRAGLQAALARRRAGLRAYEDGLAALYGYGLLNRNCASEIFRVAGQALAQAGGAAAAESALRLGGHVAGRFPESIPFVSFEAVAANWRVAATDALPSYRLRKLAQARREENPLWLGLRESNVFSSALYRWHEGDPAFVFFTDEPAWARPLAGAANLAAGQAQTAFGLASWPRDGGGNLWQGAKGALISLPELFFFNIRKNSFPGLPAAD